MTLLKRLKLWFCPVPAVRMVRLPSLLSRAERTEEEVQQAIRAQWEHEGVQALIQALETEAAFWQATAITEDVATGARASYHAGAAMSLTRVLGVLATLKPDGGDQE